MAAGSFGTLEFGQVTALFFDARFITFRLGRRGDRRRRPQLRQKRHSLKEKTAKLKTVNFYNFAFY
tara:strand:+ start:1011 stop:1208 length:198 start_codon:yes stop_codon:yes gene_type:complete